MPVDYASLLPGEQISDQTAVLDFDTVAKYVEAVGDRSAVFGAEEGSMVPPMAVAALALRGALEALAAPRGSVHGAQELEFEGAVGVGETLECKASVVQNSVRRAWRFLVVQTEARRGDGRRVMIGRTTLMVPV